MSAKIQVVLASASPARRKTLQNAGIDPLVQVAGVDEESLLAQLEADSSVGAKQKVMALARAKAREVAQNLPGELQGRSCLVIGCDSMLEFAGRVLGKPHDPRIALQRVEELAGNSGILYTGHWMIQLPAGRFAGEAAGEAVGSAGESGAESVGEIGEVGATWVHFADFSSAEARAYVASGEPLQVAGSFTIDGLGAAFIRGIEGDPHNVVGISVPLLRELAGKLGVFWPDLWC